MGGINAIYAQVSPSGWTEIIRFVAERSWREHPAALAIVVAVHVDNRPSWRALEKAGLARAGTGELTPDNPIDSRRHHVYRLDRPASGSGGS